MKAIVSADKEVRKEAKEKISGLGVEVFVTTHDKTLMENVEDLGSGFAVVDIEKRSRASKLKSLRSRHPEIPLVMITPKNTAEDWLTAESPYTAILQKPLDYDDLSRTIESMVTLLRKQESLRLPELHSERNGRLHANRIAKYLDISLKDLSNAIGHNYRKVHKTPDSKSIQNELRKLKELIVLLNDIFNSRKEILAWLNTPNIDFDEHLPNKLIKEGHCQALIDLLKDIKQGTLT